MDSGGDEQGWWVEGRETLLEKWNVRGGKAGTGR